MTMIITYSHEDKIVMMGDTRITAKDNTGKVVDYQDNVMKIFPVGNKFVIGHAGNVLFNVGHQQANLHVMIEHFITTYENDLLKMTGSEVLDKILEVWNGALLRFGRDPKGTYDQFSLGEWVDDEGTLKPQVHSYQSNYEDGRDISLGSLMTDEPAIPIIEPVFREKLDNMTFDETINHFKQGFAQVMERVETVGGEIKIYVLDKNGIKTGWLK